MPFMKKRDEIKSFLNWEAFFWKCLAQDENKAIIPPDIENSLDLSFPFR
jgi:hypothetical protein